MANVAWIFMGVVWTIIIGGCAITMTKIVKSK